MRIVSGLSLFVYFVTLYPASAHTLEPMSLTYWVDESCKQQSLFTKGLFEALAMARSAVKKLDTVTEKRHSMYFEHIFKAKISSSQDLSARHEPQGKKPNMDIEALGQVICMYSNRLRLAPRYWYFRCHEIRCITPENRKPFTFKCPLLLRQWPRKTLATNVEFRRRKNWTEQHS